MKEIFLSSLTPMLTLFLFIAIGFTLTKTKTLPNSTSKVLARLLTFAVCPALNFASMSQNFNIKYIGTYASFIILSFICILIAVFLATFLARFFVKDKENYDRNVYKYALTFGNYGYVGTPLIIALFGMKGYAFFSFLTLPCAIIIYTWGIGILIPKEEKQSTKTIIKNLLNMPTIALLVGMLVGITGLGEILYTTDSLVFITDALSKLGNCMAPLAMLLAGVTVAKYDLRKMISNKKVYIASIFRLVIIPVILIPISYGFILLFNLIGINLDNTFLFLFFFIIASPLGMNTIVFPEAFGGDPSTGASLTLISHVLMVITIPLMYALLTVIFGPAPIF